MTKTSPKERSARRTRHAAIREEVAGEEAEAAEAEAAENAGALDVALHLRITRSLDTELREQAAAEQIPTSALVRRILTQSVHEYRSDRLTEADVEEIARRVVAEQISR